MNSKGSRSQECFGLQGVPKYRFGNECDIYGEFSYTKELAKSSNGTSFVGTAMVIGSTPTSDYNEATLRMSQLALEVKNMKELNGGLLWVGKRFHYTSIHILDLKYVDLDGVGAGLDNLPLGPGKLSYGLYRSDISNDFTSTRHNLIYKDISTNKDGKLDIYTALIRGNRSIINSHDGGSVSFVHTQKNNWGGENVLGLQYGSGPGIGNKALQMGTAGDVTQGNDFKRARVFDSLTWQMTPKWGGAVAAVLQKDKNPTGTQTWLTVGGRTSYATTQNIKFIVDAGRDQIQPAASGATQRLNKVTFSVAYAKDPSFWARPELRFFITMAKWNDAAQAAANLAAPGSALSSTGTFGSQLHGHTIGVQLESWF